MKLQNLLILITGLMLHCSTHTSDIKDNQPVRKIYQRGEKQQQKFDAKQALRATLTTRKEPSAKQEIIDCLTRDNYGPDKPTSSKFARQPISATSCPLDPIPYLEPFKEPVQPEEPHYSKICYLELYAPYGSINENNKDRHCECGAHAISVMSKKTGKKINLVCISPEMAQDVKRFFHNIYTTIAGNPRFKAVWHDLDVPEYKPYAQWENYQMCTCTIGHIENGTYQDPLAVKVCECHGCEEGRPDENNFDCSSEKLYMLRLAQHYVQQQMHYHKNATLPENVQRLQKLFLEKDRKAQVEEIVARSKQGSYEKRTIRVFDPQKFDSSHPEGYVASTWQTQPDQVDRALAARIREKIQLFNKPLRTKEEEKKEQAALIYARDFLSQEELDKYQLTPEQTINPYISQKDRDAAVKKTVAEWHPLLPLIRPNLVNPIEAEEEYFKHHKK